MKERIIMAENDEKIIMLGTGNGFTFDLYNTCFILKNGDKNLLVDAGGSAEIVRRIEKAGYKLKDIHDIFISHCHTDHLLGLMWLFKRFARMYTSQGYIGELNVYCNEEVANSINNIYPSLLPPSATQAIKNNVKIHILQNNEVVNLAGYDIKFFDVYPKKNMLYGFETTLNSGKRLVFLGDETCNPILYDRIKNADYLMHEAYCLDVEEPIFKAYEKHHSTVKSVCQEMNKLNIKNLILYHTEESHTNKKELYTQEAKDFFENNVLVPNDMDEIKL
jgi:ribonuclease Z